MFEDNFLESIPEELNHGALFIVNDFFSYIKDIQNNSHWQFHDEFSEYYYMFEAFLRAKEHQFEPLNMGTNQSTNITSIIEFFNTQYDIFNEIVTNEKVNHSKERYNRIFSNSFMYEFSDGDLKRIQVLLNELRDQISESEIFDAKHQARILRRLERVQSQLHKKVSDVDRFWGLVGDAGVAMGKFGNDVKPIVDRIKEITQIVWNTQARSEDLPSGTPIPKMIRGVSNDEKE